MKDQNQINDDPQAIRNQGIRKLDENQDAYMKSLFIEEFVDKNIVKTTGYFIGRGLLEKILLEASGSEGILISFGLNRELSEGGEISLVVEAANSNEPGAIIDGMPKYCTGGPGTEGPSGTLPAIKPTPPTSANEDNEDNGG